MEIFANMNLIERTINFIASKSWGVDIEWGISQVAKSFVAMSSDAPKDALASLKEETFSVGTLPVSISNRYGTTDYNIKEISFNGVMQLEGGLCSYGVQDVITELYKAYNNPEISAVLLTMNSGGGDPQAGSELSQALKDKTKPVVARVYTCASACYMGVLNADEIIAASEYSNIGSIGAFISVNSKFLKEYSEQIIDIYATNSPNKNDVFRGLLAGDYTAAQRSIDSLSQIFQNDVKNTRKLSEKYTDTLSGGIWKASEAKKRGLIDSIGSKNYAIKRIINYLNSKK